MNPEGMVPDKLGPRTRRRLQCAGALAALLIAACVFARVSGPNDLIAYGGMARECHPVWREFAWRRFGKGDSAEEFLRRFPPTLSKESGRQGTYQYTKEGGYYIPFTGLTVTSWDGRLIRADAWSCTWQFTFFETSDAELVQQARQHP
jgi:hypothetical protein